MKLLVKVAKEFNLSLSPLVETLHNKGFEIDNKPTAKVTDEMYAVLLKEFKGFIQEKEQADQLHKAATAAPVKENPKVKVVGIIYLEKPEPKIQKKKKEEAAVEVPAEPAPVPDVPTPEEITRIETPQFQGLEILGKIDTSKLKEPTRKKEEQKIEPPIQVKYPMAYIAQERKKAERKQPKWEEFEDEFKSLVIEMASKGFTKSKQVSRYIVENRLGNKYQNISGVLEMTKNGETWNFHGGFPPKIYAELCNRLNLKNEESEAIPGKFVPYKDLNNKY